MNPIGQYFSNLPKFGRYVRTQFLPFFVFGDVALSEYFYTVTAFSLYGEYVVRCFLPHGVIVTLCCDI